MRKNIAKILLVSFGTLASDWALAQGNGQAARPGAAAPGTPAAVAVRGGAAPALPPGVTELKFGEFFKMPIGARGLEASQKLLALAGQRVRIVGYMARQETPTPGFFMLAPLPVALGDQDEILSDDLPASTIFVHLGRGAQSAAPPRVPYYAGLLRLTGTLRLGPSDESDGHVSTVRLVLDPDLAQAMTPGPAGN
jgi:hypothetical protein